MISVRPPMLFVAVCALAACTDERAADQKTDSATAAAAAPVARTTPNVVTIKSVDFAFVAPDSIEAGPVTVRLEQNGKELHQASFIRLDSGRTSNDLLAALKNPGPLPTWAVEVAGVNPTAPGTVSQGTVSLAPGNYVLICFVPSPDGLPHVAKGMIRPITVIGPAVAALPMPGDIEMRLTDYEFLVSAPLTAGPHVIRVVNTATQDHEVFLARLAPGKTAPDLARWMDKQQGPPPAEALGGISGLGVGQSASFPVTLTPGEYGLFCFLPDAKDGKPHVAHGMIRQFKVG